MRVLIGYDGSQCADDAVSDLARAGLPEDTNAVVMTAVEVFPTLPQSSFQPPSDLLADDVALAVRRARELGRQGLNDANETSKRGAQLVHKRCPSWSVVPESSTSSPAQALVGKALEWKADVIVVGSRGRSAVARMLLGSVSQQVLHQAPCSVRVGRRAEFVDLQRPPRLVIGVDGSPDAALAVSAVRARIWPPGTGVLVLAVLDSRSVLSLLDLSHAGASAGSTGEESTALRDALRGAVAELREAGLRVSPRLLAGEPRHVILEEAVRWNADCISLGARGHGRLSRFVLGSVSASVAARAGCTVEVVRAG